MSNTYAQVSFEKLDRMYRLEGPNRDLVSIRAATHKKRGGPCGNRPTADLILKYSNQGESWFKDPKTLSFKDQKQAPCEVQLTPTEGDQVELRLSYSSTGADQKMEWIQYPNQDRWIVDHWLANIARAPVPQTKIVKATGATPKTGRKMDPQFKEFFEDQRSWEKLLGTSVVMTDNNRPELNRFRVNGDGEVNQGLAQTPLAEQALEIPSFPFPRLESVISFTEKTFPHKKFEESDLLDPPPGHGSNGADAGRTANGALKGLNFIFKLSREKDWVRAKSAMDILERSAFRSAVPMESPKYLALKGFIFKHLGLQLKDPALGNKGLDIWRNALQRGVSREEYRDELDYMALELTRELFESRRSYLGLGFLTWAEGFRWSPEVEQRFDYLRGEALVDLGFADEAQKHFRDYFQEKSGFAASSFADRRLVPRAGFWLGDIDFQRGRYSEAVREYTKSLGMLTLERQFSFEGKLFPNVIRDYPQVLFNRAEASLRLGLHKNAMQDLRAFIYIAPNHPRIGLVYYKISEILEQLNAPEDQIKDAWRECIFRSPALLGGRLCSARKAVHEFATIPKENWARSIGVIELVNTPLVEDERKALSRLDPRDLTGYTFILLADAFLRVNEPSQALARLDPSEKIEMTPMIRDWIDEYRMVSLAGRLQRQIEASKFKDVVRDYEVRRKTLLYRFVRPSILWRLALAYQGLGLDADALRIMETGLTIQRNMGDFKVRPFDVKVSDWVRLRAIVSLGMLAQNQLPATEVERALEPLDRKDPATQRMWVQFYRLTKNLKQEARTWAGIRQAKLLGHEDLYRYAQVLKELKDTKEFNRVLPAELGTWLAGARVKFEEKAYPGADLLMELVEAHVNLKQPDRALELLNFLQNLDDKFLSDSVTKPMIAYKKGVIQKSVGRFDDARQSFGVAKTLSPTGLWGQLSDSAQKELPPASSGAL